MSNPIPGAQGAQRQSEAEEMWGEALLNVESLNNATTGLFEGIVKLKERLGYCLNADRDGPRAEKPVDPGDVDKAPPKGEIRPTSPLHSRFTELNQKTGTIKITIGEAQRILEEINSTLQV